MKILRTSYLQEPGRQPGLEIVRLMSSREFAAPDLLNGRHESARWYVEQKQHTTKADPQGTAGSRHRDLVYAGRRAPRPKIRRGLEGFERRLLAPWQTPGRSQSRRTPGPDSAR